MSAVTASSVLPSLVMIASHMATVGAAAMKTWPLHGSRRDAPNVLLKGTSIAHSPSAIE